MKTLMLMYVCSGVLLSLVAVPLMLRRVAPNPLYGFRVEKTLNNPKIWYAVNAYSGRQLFWIGLGTVAVALGLSFVPRLDVGTYSILCAAFTLGALGISLVLSFRLLSRL